MRIKTFFALIGISILVLSFDLLKDETYYFGELKIKKNFSYYNRDNSFTKYIVNANMYEDSVNYSQTWKSKNTGIIYFNDVPLRYNEYINTYVDVMQRDSIIGVKWDLFDNTSSRNISLNINDSFPSLGNHEILSDVLNTGQDLIIDLSSVVYADEIEISMFDGKYRINQPFYRKFKSGPTSITIPSSDLSALSGENVYVTISLIKKEFNTIENKNYKFEKDFNFIKLMKNRNYGQN